MNNVFGVICCLTAAGSFLALTMLVVRRIFTKKLPETWIYYLWLVVLTRFLLPIPSPLNMATVNFIPTPEQPPISAFNEIPDGTLTEIIEPSSVIIPETADITPFGEPRYAPQPESQPQTHPQQQPQKQQIRTPQISIFYVLSMIWLIGTGVLSLYTLISYQVFRHTLHKTSKEIRQPDILKLYKETGDTLKLKKMPVLYVNNAISTPMQAGILFPVLLLPELLIQRQSGDLRYFILHELVHYRRRDLLYKWIIQLCVCLHWFNPLVYVMKRELNTLCELSCDAHVLRVLNPKERNKYGNMLLQALETAVAGKSLPLYGVYWGNEVKTMKARFKQIMDYEKRKKPLWLLMIVIASLLAACGAMTGPASESVMKDTQTNPIEVLSDTAKAEDEQVPALLDATEAEEKPIQWVDPAIEALVREKLNKPQGDILPSDLDYIWGIELIGDTHIYFNGKDGGHFLGNSRFNGVGEIADLHLADDHLKDGVYAVQGKQYARGSVISLADFSNFRNVEYLYVSKNDLKDLAGLSNLEKLSTVGLYDNNIQDISALSQLYQVKELHIQSNQISDLTPLSGLGQLKTLVLTNNLIGSLEGLESLSNLIHLSLADNQIHTSDLTPLSGLGQLKELFLTNNLIDSLKGLESMSNLIHLSLGGNQIHTLEGLQFLSNLVYLSFEGNPIKDLSPISGMEKLVELSIDNTSIDDISVLADKTSLLALHMKNLTADSVDLAPLTALANLKFLLISQNKTELLNLRSLGELKNLAILDIAQNINALDAEIDWLREQLPDCEIK